MNNNIDNVDIVDNFDVWSNVISNSAIVRYNNDTRSTYNNIRENATNENIVNLCNTINKLQTESIGTITRRTVKQLDIM